MHTRAADPRTQIHYHVGADESQDSFASREREKSLGNQAVCCYANMIAAVHALRPRRRAMTAFSNLATVWKNTASLPANVKNW